MAIIPHRWRAQLDARRFARWLDEFAVADVVARPLEFFDPFHTCFDDLEQARYYQSKYVDEPKPVGDGLCVMTWNIKFAGGRIDFWFDGHGDRVIMSRDEVLQHLSGIAAKIDQVDPDVLLLQEVDVDSKRVAFIDQMQWLLDHTGLNYGAYASQWRADMVPAHGLGRVDMGIAVMSKYPVRDAVRIALPQMTTQDGVTRYFYLKRALLTTRVDLPDAAPIDVVNVHTEAFSTDGTKRRQLELFRAELDRIDRAGGLFVAGGDLNALPPRSTRRHGFSDVAEGPDHFDASDYRHEKGWLAPLYEVYEPAVDLEDYDRDNGPHFTHSTSAEVFWSRKLDYLFTNGHFIDGSTMTHQDASRGGMETMLLSDHAPVSARLELSGKNR